MTDKIPSPSPSPLFVLWATCGWILAFVLGAVLLFRPGVVRDEPPATLPPTVAVSEASQPSSSPEPSPPSEAVDPLDRTREAMSIAYLKEAAELMERANYERAIEYYDKALEIDPRNETLLYLRAQAATLHAQQQQGLVVQESRTEVADLSRASKSAGSEGISVRSATEAGGTLAELIVELRPSNPQPGDPFVVRIQMHNREPHPIRVKTIELVWTFDSKSSGRGQKLTPLTSVVPARGVSILWEGRSVWAEKRSKGSLEAVVTTEAGTKLSKRLWWQ